MSALRSVLLALLLCASMPASSQPASDEAAGLGLGVSLELPDGYETSGGRDIAEALLEALEMQGVGRLRLVSGDGIAAGAQRDPARIRRLASELGLSGLVVGKVTRLGSRLSVDVRLRSGRSGVVLGTYVAEVALDEPLEPAMQSLAEQLVLGALTRSEPEPLPGPPAVSTAGRRSPVGMEDVERPADPPRGLLATTSSAGPFSLSGPVGEPVSIRSGELEASEEEGVRTLLFSDVVEARQGDLRLDAERLAASYPEGDKHPSRLEAWGDVRVSQDGREAFCAEAVYDREGQRIVCVGEARLLYEGDEIAGDRMTFDLAAHGFSVEGDAAVKLAPRADRATLVPASLEASEPSDGPLVARSQRLRAEQEPEMYRIVLEGGVEVVQAGVTLRSQRLELFYPEGARHPQRMEATGEVSLEQGARRATCTRAVYREDPRDIDCLGADLREGEDQVVGDRIRFDLQEQSVRVEGAARLVLAPRPRDEGENTP